MFDSLKETFGTFTEDVAEEAEDAAAEDAVDGPDGAVDADEAEPARAPEGDAAAAPDDGRAAADGDAADAAADAEDADDGGSDRGFGARAKAFATGRTFIEREDLEGPLSDLEMALLASDVELTVAESILEELREQLTGETRAQVHSTRQVVEEALHDALLEVIAVGQFDVEAELAAAEKPVVIVFTGVNGVGKTTTIAKLSERLESQGLSTVWANGDTYRAGANEQIKEHAETLGKRVIAHEQGSDPAAVVYDAVEYAEANGVDVVLGDTAGRLHTSNDLMAQLEKIDRVVDPDYTFFVDEAVAGQDAVNRAREFDDAAAVDGVVLTKADADSDGGAAISIAHVIGKPILYLGTGQGYDDLQRFDPEALVDALLGQDGD